jgi:V/A-type H+-transporting ATPase subunit A
MKIGKIIKVSGPLVIAEGMEGAKMHEVVRVSHQRLIGEIIKIEKDKAYIQVYEDTAGLGPEEPVFLTGSALSVVLAPGLIGSLFDGIQRPLAKIMEIAGDNITRGIEVPSLDHEKKWDFCPSLKAGEEVFPGDKLGMVEESSIITHHILVPVGIEGRLEKINAGPLTIDEPVAIIKAKDGTRHSIKMLQQWPVRRSRPYREKLAPSEALVTGQRVIDTFFPIAKGGTACVPGPFGSGKTVVQHQLSKWANAQIIVYVGCGERGNEMTEVIEDFPRLKDPITGKSLMERTILIANTSNMPVAAREASIYTGITIAEYYRDMGYDVALMADSTSRWAEALREMSGRLEEMPGEEGYPAYLPSRTAEFYERAGKVVCLGSQRREGSLSVIGAVSPPGGDLSEPVSQATLKVVQVFWSLEASLAYQRHFPAINWLTSYSLYSNKIKDFYAREIAPDWSECRRDALKILQEEAELQEIVRLVGLDTLSCEDRITLETAKSLREDFLHQNAFHDIDTYSSLKKQYLMLSVILKFHRLASRAIKDGASLDLILSLPIREKIADMKYISENDLNLFAQLEKELEEQISTSR